MSFNDKDNLMDFTALTILGLSAGIITSMGFIPQLVRGYKTKKLDDVSYFMPIVLAVGMTLWFAYGFLREDAAIVLANAFGVGCCLVLISMKKYYT